MNLNPYLEVFIRALIGFAFLVLIARATGARQISQLTFYDYVVGITLGSIAGTLCIDRDIPILYSILAMAVFGVLVILTSLLTSKSIIARRMLSGGSKILISEGKFIEKNMKISRFDVNDVLRELRNQGYFDVADVQFAILEDNGKMSIMPKVASRPLQVSDTDKTPDQKGLVTNVIIDGKIMEENLAVTGKDRDWVLDQLSSQNIAKLKDVILATIDGNFNLAVYEKGQTTQQDTIFQ